MVFFRKKQKEERVEEVVQQPQTRPQQHPLKTKMFFPEELALELSEQYAYRFHHEQLPLLEANQISIHGIKMTKFAEGTIVQTIIRHTLPQAINFGELSLTIFQDGKHKAQQTFDLSYLGNVPAFSAFPWEFLFHSENIWIDDIDENADWKVYFNFVPKQIKIDVSPALETMSDEQRTRLQEVVQSLPESELHHVELFGVELLEQNGSLLAVILFRNTTLNNVKLNAFSLQIIDHNGSTVAEKTFTDSNIAIQANSIYADMLMFEEHDLTDKDFTSWNIALVPTEQ